MKRKKASGIAENIGNKPIRMVVGTKLALTLLVLAALCACAVAQENTTAYWMTKAREFSINGSSEEAISAYDNASKIDPRNETVLIRKALELQVLGKENESSKAYQKAISLLDEDLKKNPQDAITWMNKGLALSSLGKQNESNQANESVLEILNKTTEKDPKNISAWRNKAEDLCALANGKRACSLLTRSLRSIPRT